MTRRDEGQLLLASSSVGVPLNHVGTDISKQRQILTGKGLILTLFIALGIFGVSTGAARYLFPRASQSRLPVDQQTGFTVRYNPLEDDRSPTTAICTGDVSKPVLDGADFVAYFSLDPDSAGVYGTEDYVATYNGYSFWFISEENKALFEVRAINSANCTRSGVQGLSGLISLIFYFSIFRWIFIDFVTVFRSWINLYRLVYVMRTCMYVWSHIQQEYGSTG